MSEAAQASTTATSAAAAPNKRWGINILIGLVFIVAGTAAILVPLASTWAVIVVAGASLIVSGIAQIVHAFSRSWGGLVLHCLLGLLYLVAGLSFWLMPLTAAVLLTVVLAWVLIVQGIGEIWLAFTSRNSKGWAWLLVAGVITLLAGIWIVLRMPSFGLLLPGFLLGVSLLVEGWAFVLMRRA
jgi:uncharacterized membrane protein HdeD (DUF308 family)